MNSLGCKDSYLEKSIPVSEDNADDGGNNDDNGEDSSIFPGKCSRCSCFSWRSEWNLIICFLEYQSCLL